MVALTALSPTPPRPSPSLAPPRRRPPPPAPHITSSPHGRSRPAIAVAAIAGGADDYHSTIRSLNSRGRHVPRKSLGQNYMLNSKVNEELVAAAGVEAGDVVLEIGPGTGSLTAALLAAGATVFAVEKDQHMATLVKDRFGSTQQLKIINEDITKFHVRSHFLPFLEEKSHCMKKYAKVVSNLPFNVSTEVVKQLLPMGDVFSVVVLLLQMRSHLLPCVVERASEPCGVRRGGGDRQGGAPSSARPSAKRLSLLRAKRSGSDLRFSTARLATGRPARWRSAALPSPLHPPRHLLRTISSARQQDETALRLADASIQTPEYRPINVFVNFFSEPEYKFKVERTNFFPQPKVDGAVISFKLKNAGDYPRVGSHKSFFSMVNSAFNGKRKMLRKSLQHLCSSAEIEAALSNIGHPVTARPSDLMLDDFVRLHNHLAKVQISGAFEMPMEPIVGLLEH